MYSKLNRFPVLAFCVIPCVVVAVLSVTVLSFGLGLKSAPAQEAVRVNVNIVDNAAENKNLDAFVAKFNCIIDANAGNTVKRAARRQCREAAILRFMEDVEDAYEGDTAFIPARQAAIAARRARWLPGIGTPTPTPTPTPVP